MAITREETYFKSSSKEKCDVRVLTWEDTSVKPVGVFQIAHGVQEHIERYDDFARFLAGKGYIVCGNDHLGHGKTAGLEKRNTTPSDAPKKIITDMHTLYEMMHKKYPSLPYILFGHSLGSYLARSYTVKYGKELAGAIYCGSCYIPGIGIVLQPFMKAYAKIVGENYTNSAMTSVISRIANAGILFPKTHSDWLSYDRENVKSFVADPYCGGDLAASLSRDAVTIVTNGGRHGWVKKLPHSLPVMLVSGDSDSCGLFGYGTSLLYTQLIKSGVDTTYRLYKGRHEILNDNCKHEVYEDILSFLRDKV